MGMTCETEGRSATFVPAPSDSTTDPNAVIADPSGMIETCEERERRLRSNSEETALILTSMMSMRAFSKDAQHPSATNSDDDDMGEDMSDDEHDDGESTSGRDRKHSSNSEYSPDSVAFNQRLRNESNRVKSLVTKHISIDELREHFDRPIIDVAKDFGICITLMKKICRRNGIKRWPHRQIRSLSKSIASMEAAMLSAQGSERDKYRDQILNLKLKRDAVIADPNKENTMMSRPKTPTKDSSSLRPHAHVYSAPKLSPRSGATTHTSSSSSPNATSRTKSESGQTQSKGGRWTGEEHAAFLHGIRLYGKDWRRVAQVVRTRSAVQTRTHAQKYLLKFAGRFPFDAEALDAKDAATDAQASPMETTQDSETVATAAHHEVRDSMDAVDNAKEIASDTKNEEIEPVSVKKSALEAMAMILNSPQFKSYRELAPPPLQMDQTAASDDAPMESSRVGVNPVAAGAKSTGDEAEIFAPP